MTRPLSRRQNNELDSLADRIDDAASLVDETVFDGRLSITLTREYRTITWSDERATYGQDSLARIVLTVDLEDEP